MKQKKAKEKNLEFHGLWVKWFNGWLGEDPIGTLKLCKNVSIFKMTANDVL